MNETDILYDYENIYDVDTDFLPIYRLCASILFKALEDLEFYDQPLSPRYLFSESAREWLYDDYLYSTAPIPLTLVSSVINVPISEIRKFADKIMNHDCSLLSWNGRNDKEA